MLRIAAALRATGRDRKGIAALEFALAASFLIVVFFGIIDFGRAIDQSIRLETAARAGAQYALSAPADTPGIINSVKAALAGQTGLHEPTVTPSCACPNGNNPPTADPGCTSGCSGQWRLVEVAVQQDFSAFYFKKITTLTGNVTFRVQ